MGHPVAIHLRYLRHLLSSKFKKRQQPKLLISLLQSQTLIRKREIRKKLFIAKWTTDVSEKATTMARVMSV